MKRKLALILQVILLLVVGTVAGTAAGRIVPSLPLSGAAAKAASLSAEPVAPLAPVGSGFTYQGRLKDTGSPAGGQYDFAFSLYDDPNAGNLVSGPITRTNQTVTEGLFTLTLDFGANAFDGNARYLQISAKRSADPTYTPLTGRQPLTPAPYALFALKTQPYKNVVVVAQSGGQYTSIQAALNSITDNSASNRYVVWVGPGTYTETVAMKPYVDLEGAGENITKITYTGSNGPDSGTVAVASNAELRSLTVENTGGVHDAYAVAIVNSGSPSSLLNVTATASGSNSDYDYGVYNHGVYVTMNNVTAIATGAFGSVLEKYGVYNNNSYVRMNNVTAKATSATNSHAVHNTFGSSILMNNVIARGETGVYNSGSSILMNNVSADGVTGVYNTSDGTVNIHNSTITGSTFYIVNNGRSVRVGASELFGGYIGSGSATCAGVYDGNYTFYANTCP